MSGGDQIAIAARQSQIAPMAAPAQIHRLVRDDIGIDASKAMLVGPNEAPRHTCRQSQIA
jgi:hypothetical protein